jgi:Fe-S cluster biogenesis protein NfuA
VCRQLRTNLQRHGGRAAAVTQNIKAGVCAVCRQLRANLHRHGGRAAAVTQNIKAGVCAVPCHSECPY